MRSSHSVEMLRGDKVAATPRPRRGHSAETSVAPQVPVDEDGGKAVAAPCCADDDDDDRGDAAAAADAATASDDVGVELREVEGGAKGGGAPAADADAAAADGDAPAAADAPLEDVDLEAQKPADDASKADDDDDDADDDDDDEYGDGTARTLAVVAFCGSLDDLTLFVPMLAGGAIGPLALATGAAVATAFVVAICLFLNVFRRVSELLQSIPLVCVTTAFFIYLTVKAAFLTD